MRPIIKVVVCALLVGVLHVRLSSGPTHSEREGNDVKADRVLTATEIAEIARLSDVLISRAPRNDPYENAGEQPLVAMPGPSISALDRNVAIERLGTYRHVYCMPALLAVLRDASDERGIRANCVLALSQIPHKDVFDHLLVTMMDHDLAVADYALGSIRMLSGERFDFNLHASKDSRERQAQKINEWWKANRDRVTLKFEMSGGIP